MKKNIPSPTLVQLLLLFSCAFFGIFLGILGLVEPPSSGPPYCDSKPMQPGDVCYVYVNGQFSHEYTYFDGPRSGDFLKSLAFPLLIGSSLLVGVGLALMIPMAKRAERIRRAQSHNRRGNTLGASKRYEETLTAFDKAIKLAPTNALYHSNRGAVLLELKRYEEALDACKEASTIAPNTAAYVILQGKALYYLKRYKEALAVFDQAIKLAPSNELYHSNREAVLRELNRPASNQ